MNPEIERKIIINVIIIVLAIILNIVLTRGFKKLNKKLDNKAKNKKQKTYIRLTSSIINYAVLLILVVIILQVNGVNISSVVAGVGIVSVTIGLALQDALKDIIMGLNILIDNYFHVGDTLKVGDFEGKGYPNWYKEYKITRY